MSRLVAFSFLVLIWELSLSQTTVTIDVDPIGDDALEVGCSLREAISLANAGLTEGLDCSSVLTGTGFPLSYEFNLPEMRYQLLGDAASGEAGGDLDVDAEISFQGAGSNRTVIEGNELDRVLHLTTFNSSVTLRDLQITGGAVRGDNNGGGILVEGGALDVERVVFSDNQAIGEIGQTAADGGGIASVGGRLRIGPATVFEDNRATGLGGAVFSDNVMTVDGAVFERNSASDGGAVFALTRGAIVTIENCLVRGNTALSFGGGMRLQGEIAGVVAVEKCSIVENSAFSGGGIFGAGVDLANSTIAANQAERTAGGIRLNQSRLTGVTIAGNVAQLGVGGCPWNLGLSY
ncbi:MAG: hypothetical protein AAF358_26100 [Pseudomonadota bacterium]